MATLPKYRINDLVYLQTSAYIGKLESYRVDSLQNKGGGWVYRAIVEQRPPSEVSVNDRNDLKEPKELLFIESELITGCEAMAIAVTVLDRQYGKLVALRESKCDVTGIEDPPSPRTPGEVLAPRFDADERVWLKASAMKGFIETAKVTNIHRDRTRRQWYYELDIKGDYRNRDTYGTLTLGYNKRPERLMVFWQEELITECDALTYAIDHLLQEVSSMAADMAAVCE